MIMGHSILSVRHKTFGRLVKLDKSVHLCDIIKEEAFVVRREWR
jgi:hypothetical protein